MFLTDVSKSLLNGSAPCCSSKCCVAILIRNMLQLLYYQSTVTSLVFTFASDVWKCRTSIHPCSCNTSRGTLLTPLLSNLQPIGRAFALVQPASDRTTLTPEPVKSTEEQVEVIKVGVAHWLLLFFLVCLFRGHVGV